MKTFEVSSHSPETLFYETKKEIKANNEKEAALEFCKLFFFSQSLFELGTTFEIWSKEKLSSTRTAALFRLFEITVESIPSFTAEELR